MGKVQYQSLQDIIAANEYLAENYWFLIKTDNDDRRLNQSEFYDKVNIQSCPFSPSQVDSDLRSHIHKIVAAAANQGYDGGLDGYVVLD